MRDELAIDQAYDDERSMLFDLGVLSEPLELLGQPVVNLTVAVDRPQANLVVRLCSVAGTGESTLVSWGALNLNRRDGNERSTPLVPGERYPVSVELNAVGERIPAGSRLRVALSTAYWPQLWPSPEPVRLTVSRGDCTLELPVRECRPEDPVPSFRPAEESTAVTGTIAERSHRTRRRHIGADGATTIEDHQSYGATISATGTDYAHSGIDLWTIDENDPLSARAECSRTVTIDRDGWHVRVESRSTLTSTVTAFEVEDEVVAFDDGRELFRRTTRSEIPRDGV